MMMPHDKVSSNGGDRALNVAFQGNYRNAQGAVFGAVPISSSIYERQRSLKKDFSILN
jgi:hypothetical protein